MFLLTWLFDVKYSYTSIYMVFTPLSFGLFVCPIALNVGTMLDRGGNSKSNSWIFFSFGNLNTFGICFDVKLPYVHKMKLSIFSNL